MTTTVNYTDIGLTAAQIVDLKRPWRSTAWRLKVQRPKGVQTFSANTAETVKIDTNGVSGSYPLDTLGNNYIRMVHDSKVNRTFVLQSNALNSTTLGIVSIINHDRKTTDADYIETLNAATAASGWPSEYTTDVALDMDYNPDSQELVIALPGKTAGASYYGPGIMLVDVARTINELAANTCSTLKDNPNYLACSVVRADKSITNRGSNTFTKFVRYFKGKYYTWTCVTSAGVHIIYQLGYYSAISHAYTICFQNGYPTDVGEVRADGETFDNSLCYPNQPRCDLGMSQSSWEPATGYSGDPTCGLGANVVSFEICPEESGYIIIVTTPVDHETSEFSAEPMIYRISISLMMSELTEASRLLDTKSQKVSAVNFSGSYSIPTYPPYNFLSFIFSENTGGGPNYVKASMSIDPDSEYKGFALWVEDNLGLPTESTADPSTGSTDPLHGTGKCNSFGDSATATIIHIGIHPTNDTNPFDITWTVSFYKAIPGLVETISVLNTPALAQPTDTDRPEKIQGNYPYTDEYGNPQTYPFMLAKKNSTLYSCARLIKAYYSASLKKYIMTMGNNERIYDRPGYGVGIYIYLYDSDNVENNKLNIYTSANSDLVYDYIGALDRVGNKEFLLASNSYTDISSVILYYGDNAALQIFDLETEAFDGDAFTASLAHGAVGTIGAIYDPERLRIGFCTEVTLWPGHSGATVGEIWFYSEPLTDGVYEWDRNMRVWWDGTNPDMVLGDQTSGDGGDPEIYYTFINPQFSSSKQQASNTFNFEVVGDIYLPWIDNDFNNPLDNLPGVLNSSGTLTHGTRLIVERGVYSSAGVWTWIPEGTFFILKEPVQAEAGIANMSVSCGGPISMIVTRSIYRGSHKPTETVYTGVTLVTDDDLTFYYEVLGETVTDWNTKPSIKIYRDGVDDSHQVSDYEVIDTSTGTVTFKTSQSGHTIYATFNAYNSGTNEAEDIILCILRYPNELNGCGLDDSYFTRLITSDTPTTDDNLTYTMTKNMVVDSDDFNVVYRDGTPITTGFTWDYREGTITFSASQSAYVITADYKHYTIQKSGATLQPIYFNPRKQKDAYDAIQEVLKRVSPNYVFREGRDGKLECDFMTQKAAGSEDLTIDDTARCLFEVQIEPAYEQLATSVISYGQGDLSTLQDYCIGCTVTDQWTTEMAAIGQPGWHASTSDVQTVVDGDPATGVITGYGRWGEGTYTVQATLIAAGETGIPCLDVDMGESREVETIVIARPSLEAGETTVQQQSVWISNDGSTFTKLIDAFELGPGANQQFKSGTNFDEGTTFRYIRVNIHSLGLYEWKGHTDSQMGISEIQCYPPAQIEGYAELQTDDPTADLYDYWGLLDRYGKLILIARSGQPDSALDTQALADEDAAFNLKEVIRLLAKIEIRSPWFPVIPWGSTIKITNGTTGTSITAFIESRSAGDDGDTYTAMTLP
jgi:hypothetical protein